MHPLMNIIRLTEFVAESNRIEGITRPPTVSEVQEAERFLELKIVTIEDLEQFVSVYQPGARLRETRGLDVRVGSHIAPRGGPELVISLSVILTKVAGGDLTQFTAHLRYEFLHPFTDCNGRSGRMLWLWQMLRQYQFPNLSFLQHWYYDTLDNADDR